MKKRLQILGAVILGLSFYIIMGARFPYAWLVGVAGLLFGVYFEVKTFKSANRKCDL